MYKPIHYLLILFLNCWVIPAHSQIGAVTFQSDTRYDRISQIPVEHLQERVRLGFTVGRENQVQLVGILTSGNSFGNDWDTIHDFKSNKVDRLHVVFRNLYIQRSYQNLTVQAGALNPEPAVGSGGLGPSGWVDGIRVQWHKDFGDMKVVAGSLGAYPESNLFYRPIHLNFLEIEFSKTFFEHLLTKIAYEKLNHDDYVRSEFRIDQTLLTDRVIQYFVTTLYNFEKKTGNVDVGVKADLLKTIFNHYENRFNAQSYFSYLDPKLADRSSMIPAFFTNGPRLSFQIDGKINRNGTIIWFARHSYGQKIRDHVGITIKLKSSSAKAHF